MKKIPTLTLVAALLSASLHSFALAQSGAPPVAASAASAASAQAPTGPRMLTPTEQRNNADNASAPDLRPDRPVVPQISVPFGRAPPPAPGSAPSTPRRRGEAAPPPAPIGDAAARCESMTSDLERAACRKRLAQAKAPH
jgi:hypothetical protein